jgi:hypothetical protein
MNIFRVFASGKQWFREEFERSRCLRSGATAVGTLGEEK